MPCDFLLKAGHVVKFIGNEVKNEWIYVNLCRSWAVFKVLRFF